MHVMLNTGDAADNGQGNQAARHPARHVAAIKGDDEDDDDCDM